ncbi:MAG TPA: SPOR domain-containing protein [Candidatus Acidoferrum sp.]|nr:SPOR domain-containing protein [Candidatus Acidoferrum sp.]
MRQRLVGILVLGCLAIILVPWLLDGEGIKSPPLSTKIPAVPKFDTAPVAEPTHPAIVADTLPAPAQEPAPTPPTTTESKPEPATAKPATPPLPVVEASSTPVAVADKKPAAAGRSQPDALEAAVADIMSKDKKAAATAGNTPKLDSSGLPLSYVVRMASFTERKNADALVARLVAAGFKGYLRPLNAPNGQMFVVFAGPVLTRDEAVGLQGKLATCKQGKCFVEPFTNQPMQPK